MNLVNYVKNKKMNAIIWNEYNENYKDSENQEEENRNAFDFLKEF